MREREKIERERDRVSQVVERGTGIWIGNGKVSWWVQKQNKVGNV